MVNLLIGNKNIEEINILCHELTNEKKFEINAEKTAKEMLNTYWKINPDILVLDSDLPDMKTRDIIDKISSHPSETKNCNTILTVPNNYVIDFSNVEKINKIIHKPILNNILSNAIKTMSIDFNIPDITDSEITGILLSLNINGWSKGYKYLKEAIKYCYYYPYQLDNLSNVINYLSYKYEIPVTQIRDKLTSSIRPFRNNDINKNNELYTILSNDGKNVSLKDFLERIVWYIIKTKKEDRFF